MEKKDLKPAIVFRYFEEVCQVPRPSKKEEKIRAYLLDFAQKHNLACKTDEAGNVLMSKPATAGKENLKTVSLALQNFMGQHKSDWNQMMATATVITIPMIVVYFMAQKYFIEGITFSGLKG